MPRSTTDTERLGAIILTGGASSRMGFDKALLDIGGTPAVHRVASLAAQVGAAATVTAGGLDYGYPTSPDPSPLCGPVGGIVAAARALRERGCTRVLALAVDAPTITPEDLIPLLKQATGAVYEGLHLPLAGRLEGMPWNAEADWPIARLIEQWGLIRLPCPAERALRLRGANTPAEHAALAQAFATRVAGDGSDST